MDNPEDERGIFFGECLRSKPETADVQPGLLNRGSVFVDATSLLAIWPEELDDVRILVCKLNEFGNLEHYTLFEPRLGSRDAVGQWGGRDVVMTNQYGHFTQLVSVDDDPQPITRLLATAQTYSIQSGTTEPVVYPLEFPAKRYSVRALSEWMEAGCVSGNPFNDSPVTIAGPATDTDSSQSGSDSVLAEGALPPPPQPLDPEANEDNVPVLLPPVAPPSEADSSVPATIQMDVVVEGDSTENVSLEVHNVVENGPLSSSIDPMGSI